MNYFHCKFLLLYIFLSLSLSLSYFFFFFKRFTIPENELKRLAQAFKQVERCLRLCRIFSTQQLTKALKRSGIFNSPFGVEHKIKYDACSFSVPPAIARSTVPLGKSIDRILQEETVGKIILIIIVYYYYYYYSLLIIIIF